MSHYIKSNLFWPRWTLSRQTEIEGVLNWPFDRLKYLSTGQAAGRPDDKCLFIPPSSVGSTCLWGCRSPCRLNPPGIGPSTPESSVYFFLVKTTDTRV